MASLVSSWWNSVESLPEDYVFPPDIRPGAVLVPISKAIPVIDLEQVEGAHDKSDLMHRIIKAGSEFGLFQVINHGVSESLMDEVMNVYKEFFELPIDEKAIFYSQDKLGKSTKLLTSGRSYLNEKVHFWKDALQHPCHPVNDHIHSWPNKPANYREVVGRYSEEVRKLSLKILELISEGLGLEEGYFQDDLSKDQKLVVNYYPPCPDPSLALGTDVHRDPNLITLLHQEIYGLQILKDGQWIGVDPLPNAFIVSISYQLEIITNGKLKSPIHRAVTNSTTPRVSIVTFINPSLECFIQPAKEFISASDPPRYKAAQFKELFKNYIANLNSIDDMEQALDSYKYQDNV